MKNLILKYFFSLSIIFTLSISVYAQNNYDFFKSVKQLSIYLASEDFASTKGKLSDPERMNLIFRKAESITPSVSEALLVAAFSTIPFKHFPFVTPILKLRFNIPLPVGPLNIFKKKINTLPARLFFDSPKSKFGDVDKLAHFFANAFLVYNFNCYKISDFMGILIELFEKNFKVHGFVDTKDLTINHLGALFGKALHNNKNARPSEFLSIYNLLFLTINLF